MAELVSPLNCAKRKDARYFLPVSAVNLANKVRFSVAKDVFSITNDFFVVIKLGKLLVTQKVLRTSKLRLKVNSPSLMAFTRKGPSKLE